MHSRRSLPTWNERRPRSNSTIMQFTKGVERLGGIPRLESDQIPIHPLPGVLAPSYDGDKLKRALPTATRSVEIPEGISTPDDQASYCRGSAVRLPGGAASSASELGETAKSRLDKADRWPSNVSYDRKSLSMNGLRREPCFVGGTNDPRINNLWQSSRGG
jgi:hypothetical protein